MGLERNLLLNQRHPEFARLSHAPLGRWSGTGGCSSGAEGAPLLAPDQQHLLDGVDLAVGIGLPAFGPTSVGCARPEGMVFKRKVVQLAR